MATTDKFRLVRRKLVTYKQEAESWQADHDKAMACFDIDDLLSDGIQLYRRLKKHAQSVSDHEELLMTWVEPLFRHWLATSQNVMSLYRRHEDEYLSRDFDRARPAVLQAYCEDAEDWLAERELRRITPSGAQLAKMAARMPPHASWYEDDGLDRSR